MRWITPRTLAITAPLIVAFAVGLFAPHAWGQIGTPAPAAPGEPTPLVWLDARDPGAGTDVWNNRGTLGPFKRIGSPYVRPVAGIAAVTFDGRYDAYQGPVSVPALEGASPRTIEVWAYNPNVETDEETLVTWGKRGGPERTLLAFDWGKHPTWGAATHWAEELSWNGTPSPGHWHHLTYTYDGKTARVYDDGILKASRDVVLETAPGSTINIGAQNGQDGKIEFVQAASLEIASVRVLPAALSAEQIAQDFAADASRFGATKADVRQGPDPPASAEHELRDAILPNEAHFPQISPAIGTHLPPFRTVPLSGPMVHVAGAYWTAVTFTTPPGARRDLRFYLSLSWNVADWTLVTAAGPVSLQYLDVNPVVTAKERAQAPPGLSKTDTTVIHLSADPGIIHPGEHYIILFRCSDGRPDPIKVSMTLAPEGAGSSLTGTPKKPRPASTVTASGSGAARSSDEALPADELEGLDLSWRAWVPDMDARGRLTGTARVGVTIYNNTRFTLTSVTLLIEILGEGAPPIVLPLTAYEFSVPGDDHISAIRPRSRLLPTERAWVEGVINSGPAHPPHGYWIEVVEAHGRAAPVSRPSPAATLAVAAILGDLDVAKAVLASHPEEVNTLTHGETPLHLAAIYNHLAVARLLLEHGARIEARDDAGLTPLLRAVVSNRLALVRLLLARHADPAVRDPAGHSALDLARDYQAKANDISPNYIADTLVAAVHGELPTEPTAPLPALRAQYWHPGSPTAH